jgi:hypothetical protein
VTDIWVCATCHSINRQRNDHCYKCGSPQAEAETGSMADLRVEAALANRTVVRYRSSWLRALVASVLILTFAALSIILLVASLDAAAWLREQLPIIVAGGSFDEAGYLRQVEGLVIPGLMHTGIAIAALLAFSAWLSRVTSNIPALGGGLPGTTPTKAFIYPLIPIFNLFKVPPMIQDAMYRVDPRSGGFFMIAAAWFGLVGSWLISFFVGWWVNLRLATAFTSRSQGELLGTVTNAFDVQFALDVVTTCMVSAGAVILVLVIIRIERRSIARDAEIQAAAVDLGIGRATEAMTASVESLPGAG